MRTCEQEIEDHTVLNETSPILLSGDNPHTARALQETLRGHGFNVQFALDYSEIEPLWRRQRDDSLASILILLEVSEQRSIEAAVDTALRLKSHDPYQFVGYLAEPILWVGGLIGDAIFPRSPQELPDALKKYFIGA